MDLYGNIKGVGFRVQVDKVPDIETVKAIYKMAELALNITTKKPKPNDTDNRKTTR